MSGMANPKLETGSLGQQENAASENAGADVELSHTTNYLSTADDYIQISLRGDEEKPHKGIKNIEQNLGAEGTETDGCACSSSVTEQSDQTCSSRVDEEFSTCHNVDEVSQYENEVLNDIFYESDGSDSERRNSFVRTGYFESESLSSTTEPAQKNVGVFNYHHQDEKACENSGARSMVVENIRHEVPHLNDLTVNNNTSSVNNYCFIDASSLNDETEISSISLPGANLPPYSDSVNCVPIGTRKSSSLQNGHERTAEFERELKLTETLEPLIEPRKVIRVDSISEGKPEGRLVEKEALVVEIKEADSGESDYPSPSIDNNKRVQCEYKGSIVNEIQGNNSNDPRTSALIRGHTFQLEPGDTKFSHLRQERERRQGSLVFGNSIPQYSGHRVDDSSFSNVSNSFSPLPYFPTKTSSLDSSAEKLKFSTSQDNDVFSSFNLSTLSKADGFDSGSYLMTKSATDKLSEEFSEIDDNSITECMSLPMTFNGHIISGSRSGTMRRLKRNDVTPIMSGSVSSNDYSEPEDSGMVSRKTEPTPVAPGGSVLMTVPEEKIKPTRMSSSMTAWVVDMSDCGKTNKKSNPASPNMSQSFSSSDCTTNNLLQTKTPDKQSSLGFFVNLKDIDSPKAPRSNVPSLKKGEVSKQSFFIDISTDSDQTKVSKSPRDKCEKKNIFPMFIDLKDSESSKSVAREMRSSSSSKPQVRASDDSEESSAISGESKPKEKRGVFMFIESDSPVVRRRTLSTSRATLLRHSWNMDKIQGQSQNYSIGNEDESSPRKTHFHREHKRAHSVSVDPHMHLKFVTKKSDSSSSLNQTGNMNFIHMSDTSSGPSSRPNLPTSRLFFDYGSRETPPNSHVEIVNDDPRGCVRDQEYKEHIDMCSSTEASGDVKGHDDDRSDGSLWDKTGTESTSGHTRKSETFDISNSGSDPSPGSDNQGFELEDYRSDRIHELERDSSSSTKISETHKSLTETIKQIEYELEDDFEIEISRKNKNDGKTSQEAKPLCAGFVRLSDLDKTPAKKDVIVAEKNSRISSVSYRMSKSIPETSWVESKLALHRSTGPCQVKTISSKKFSTIMSTSLPAKHESTVEEFENNLVYEGIPSESDLSSMQSSMGRSGADVSTEETETSSFAVTKPYNRLGEDLLRMFLEEINPDVTLDVSGRRIRAHKCILSSRCQYFAAILSGGWIESAGNVISLQGYSYSSVHFALCHIYSGESNIPDSISIVELATLADMLCLEGLKEVIGYTLKVKYCHLFHKPCQICSVGVLECMPLAAAYGLDEVYRKSLRWITRHFVRIWPTKDFAALPRELMDKCYQQHIVHMSADNILQTIMDCNKLLAILPNVRWAEPVFRTVSNLLETALKFLSSNFSIVLSNEHFQALGKDLTWNISRVEDNVLSAADRLPPDQACKSYSKLYKLLASVPPEDSSIKSPWGPLFIDFLRKIQGRVERCLVKEAPRASRTTNWFTMDLELRRRIQELACLVILPQESLKRPTRHSNFLKETKTSPSQSAMSRSLGLRRVKLTIADQTGKVPRNPVPQVKNFMTKPKTDPLERKVQAAKTSLTSESNIRPKSWPNKLEVKSRYLEPRNKPVRTDNAPNGLPDRVVAQPRRKIMISSSDSSRTSSPAMKRAANSKPTTKLKFPVKKDVKALSTDSLADTSGTKTAKKEATSKSCGITRPESPFSRPKDTEIGLSADSLVESKKKTIVMKKPGKMDTSMSTDSLMAEISVRPKTNVLNKKSPTLGRTNVKNTTVERAKKSSPPMNQKSPLSATRRPLREGRSVESSTAASRSRAAATTVHHEAPSLRRNLADASRIADIPNRIINGVTPKISSRQSTPSRSTPPAIKKEKKESNPSSSESPSKRSPKSNGISRPSRPTNMGKKTFRGIEEKLKGKGHAAQVLNQPTVGARSGTFLKEEPTILGKLDMKTTQVIS